MDPPIFYVAIKWHANLLDSVIQNSSVHYNAGLPIGIKMKQSDLCKLLFVIFIVEFSCALPLGVETSYESAVSARDFGRHGNGIEYWTIPQYDQELADAVPLPYPMQPAYWMPANRFQLNRNYPLYNERAKPWIATPSKRNSELINSLLGLPKNMEQAGK